jgi:hypothetical protein
MSNFKKMFNSYSNPTDFVFNSNPKGFWFWTDVPYKCAERRKVPKQEQTNINSALDFGHINT